MLSIRTETIIGAPVGKVWQVLTDFGAYPIWNPVIQSVRGTAALNNKILISIKLPGMPGLKIPCRIEVCDTEKELRWQGAVPMTKWLFAGDHYFKLQAKGDQTRLIHGEDLSGLALNILQKKLEKELNDAYPRLNAALKQEAER